VLATAALVVNAIFSGPAGAIEGLGVVFAGVPAYLIWRTRVSKQAS
jgi:hypothetical protein